MTTIAVLAGWVATRHWFHWVTSRMYREDCREVDMAGVRARMRADAERYGVEGAWDLEMYRLEREYPGSREIAVRMVANAGRYGIDVAYEMELKREM